MNRLEQKFYGKNKMRLKCQDKHKHKIGKFEANNVYSVSLISYDF